MGGLVKLITEKRGGKGEDAEVVVRFPDRLSLWSDSFPISRLMGTDPVSISDSAIMHSFRVAVRSLPNGQRFTSLI